MGKRTSHGAIESSEVCYDTLEQWARGKIQVQLQPLLEEEVTTFLGRSRYERRGTVAPIDPPIGSRNGYGHPPRFFNDEWDRDGKAPASPRSDRTV